MWFYPVEVIAGYIRIKIIDAISKPRFPEAANFSKPEYATTLISSSRIDFTHNKRLLQSSREILLVVLFRRLRAALNALNRYFHQFLY